VSYIFYLNSRVIGYDFNGQLVIAKWLYPHGNNIYSSPVGHFPDKTDSEPSIWNNVSASFLTEKHLFTPVPIKIGIIFKSYERLSSMQLFARRADELGLQGGFWFAEAYHWFRKYGYEARGAAACLAAVAAVTRTIPIGWGIGSPYMRHPTIQASEACAIDELSGGRFIMGMGAGKVGINYLDVDLAEQPPVKVHRDSIEIFRRVVKGEPFAYKGEIYTSEMPGIDPDLRFHRDYIPVYIGATGPGMQRLAGEIADGLLLPGLTSPGFVRFARKNLADGFAKANKRVPDDFPLGGVILCSISSDGHKAREAARRSAAIYVVNKVRNIQNDDILSSSGITDEELLPLRQRIAQGNDNLTDLVTDDMMRKFGVVAGSPSEALEILQALVDAGLNLPLMEVVGASEADKLETIEFIASHIVPNIKPAKAA
jgi:alkanesulfonate monooxygenase SsuD/methylene tetrahydromethanopterin reductase-like flavin-dependent oxidoreductase (luciferase family)